MKEAINTIDKYQPLWGSWRLDGLIARESGYELYRVYKEEWGKNYISAVKLHSFQVGTRDVMEAQALGLESAELPVYFKSLVGNIQNEIELMYRLRGNSNIVAYEDHMIFEKDGRKGWDVLIRMEYLEPLSCVAGGGGLEAVQVAHLGTDICRALEACAREGIVHRDIKDSSIFVSARGEYKLGSFSMARELNGGGRTVLSSLNPLYMSPELYKEQGYDASADIYSLGIVMYKLLNRGRLPFLPLPPGTITAAEIESALLRRMSGEELPLPVDAGGSLGTIVLKACSFDKKDRYRSPVEFRQKLERYLKAGGRSQKADASVSALTKDHTEETLQEKEEAASEALSLGKLEIAAAADLAVQAQKKDKERRIEDMRYIRNVCIVMTIAALAFAAAFFTAYKTEPAAKEPEAKAASIPLKAVTPSPAAEAEPSPAAATEKNGEEYYNDGMRHMKYERYWQAIAAFEEAKKLGYDSKKADSQIRSARKRLELKKLNSNAMKLYEQKDYEKAIVAFAELSKADSSAKSLPQYSDSFFSLAEKHNLSGVEYHNQGKLKQSLQEFEAALGMLDRMKKEIEKPDQSRFSRQYGIYEMNRSSLREKLEKIDECIRSADEYNRTGVKLFNEGSLEKAKDEFEKALEQLERIRQLAPKYQEDQYAKLMKLCSANLISIEEKLAAKQ